jgi:D-alanine--poly(phosphoribitol) ligase subunit 1
MIRRSATLSFIRWALIEFGFNREDVFMNQSPFTFDVSLCDLFCSFSLGGTLVLNSASQMKDQDGFLERIRKYQCTVWTSTPSFVYLFLRHPEFNRTHLSELRSMIFMGEELPARTCAHLFSSFPGIILANAYGPTEATIVTTHVFVTPEMANSGRNIPIGKAKTGALLRIIDPSTSAEGELQICGDHVSEGYYKKPEITSEKFIVKDGMKCYATGDLVRKEGDLFYFLGRNDDQVKFNGYRIEPDEISTVAITHSGVADAVTIPLKRGNDVRKLILFIIPANPEEGTKLKKSLLDHLRIKLPYYMIPSDLVSLPEFPFNSSHKLDKIQLASRYMNGEFSSTPD